MEFLSSDMHRSLEWEGKDAVIMVHIGPSDIGNPKKEILLRAFEQVGNKLKNRPKQVIISRLLIESPGNWHRVDVIRT